MAESFGGCLGLRVAAAAPDLVQRLVLVNPATSFAHALGGLPAAIAASNLLSLFPAPLYQVTLAAFTLRAAAESTLCPACPISDVGGLLSVLERMFCFRLLPSWHDLHAGPSLTQKDASLKALHTS